MAGAHDSRDPRSPETLCARHLLLLDEEVEPSDVIALVTNHFPALAEPVVVADADPRWGHEVLEWRLTRHSRLHGPMFVPAAVRAELELPDWATRVFALVCPRDREPAPPPSWLTDSDGLHLFFPAGLPNREEGRSLDLLIALARRLHLALRLADEPVDPLALEAPSASRAALAAAADAPARILVPDPEAHVDVFVYSPYWLAPDVLLARLTEVDAGAREPDPVPPEALEKIAHLISADDPEMRDGYAVEVPLDSLGPRAGLLEIGVLVEEALPRAVAAHLESPQVMYHLRWVDTEQRRYLPEIDAELRRIRTAAALRLDRLAAEVMRLTAGVGVDQDGFLLSEHQLG
ncbi:hypothetical protein AB0I45_05460 [Brevibacterium sp. NPDC049920]|uniref:hypothetical protein n=1 Tax=Brevibacterium sp. NPDC049920 TaxID=3155279 RepID=UPI0025ECFE58|nr:hypothetical protein [uncultured Brevibacterium sp.]